MEERITLIAGDAGEVLSAMEDSFDFIFMDAAKGQYIHFSAGCPAAFKNRRASCV